MYAYHHADGTVTQEQLTPEQMLAVEQWRQDANAVRATHGQEPIPADVQPIAFFASA